MLRSIATVSISGTLPEKLHAIAAAGYQGVEIFENDLLYYTGTPRDIRNLAAELGLKITLFQPFRDFEGASRVQFAANLQRAKRKFALMHELGCNTMLLCSNVQPDCSPISNCRSPTCARWPILPSRRGLSLAMKRWRGEPMSTAGVRHGKGCSGLTARRWASSLIVSIFCRSVMIYKALPTCRLRKSPSCSWPTRR